MRLRRLGTTPPKTNGHWLGPSATEPESPIFLVASANWAPKKILSHQFGADREPRHSLQVEIADDEVECGRARDRQSIIAARGNLDGMTEATKEAGRDIPKRRPMVDDEHTKTGRSPRGVRSRVCRRLRAAAEAQIVLGTHVLSVNALREEDP
jgi:hypothetical protein